MVQILIIEGSENNESYGFYQKQKKNKSIYNLDSFRPDIQIKANIPYKV